MSRLPLAGCARARMRERHRRPLLLLHAHAAGRGDDQDRASVRGRLDAQPGRRRGAGRRRHGQHLPVLQRRQAIGRAEPQGSARREDRARDRRPRRRDDRELATRHGGIAWAWASRRSRPSIRASSTARSRASARTGRCRRVPAYDHIIQAVSGIMSVTGTPETAPSRTGPPLVDYLTGLSAAVAILAALRERDRTGRSAVDRRRHARLRRCRHGLDRVGPRQWRRAGRADRQCRRQRRAVVGTVPDQHLASRPSSPTPRRSSPRCAARSAGPSLLDDPRFREPADAQAEPGRAARHHRGVPGRAPGDRMGTAAGRGGRARRRGPLGPRAAGRGAGRGARSVPPPRRCRTRAARPRCRRPASSSTDEGSRPSAAPPLLAADNDSVLAELGYDAQQRRALRDDGVW